MEGGEESTGPSGGERKTWRKKNQPGWLGPFRPNKKTEKTGNKDKLGGRRSQKKTVPKKIIRGQTWDRTPGCPLKKGTQRRPQAGVRVKLGAERQGIKRVPRNFRTNQKRNEVDTKQGGTKSTPS